MSLKAQGQLDWLLKQSEFKPIFTNHLHQVRDSNYPTASIVLFKPNADSLVVYLSSYVYLNEAKKYLPASFTTVEGQPFLIYDGSELLIEDKQQWFETVRQFVGKRLCDNLQYLELLKQPGPKELRVPCSIIYDGQIDKVIFVGGKLRKREVVSKVPYYLE